MATKSKVPEPVRLWLLGRYRATPYQNEVTMKAGDTPERVVFVKGEDFTDFLASKKYDVSKVAQACVDAKYIFDMYVDLTIKEDPRPVPSGIRRLGLPLGMHTVYAIRTPVLGENVAAPKRKITQRTIEMVKFIREQTKDGTATVDEAIDRLRKRPSWKLNGKDSIRTQFYRANKEIPE